MLREAAPFYLAGAFTLVYARADVLLLKPLSFDAEVGAYRAAGQLVEVVKQLPVLLMTATFPQLARGFQDSRAGAGAHRARDHRPACWAAASCWAERWRSPPSRSSRCCSGADFGRAVPALRMLALAVPLLFVNCGVLHFFVARDRGDAEPRVRGGDGGRQRRR